MDYEEYREKAIRIFAANSLSENAKKEEFGKVFDQYKKSVIKKFKEQEKIG